MHDKMLGGAWDKAIIPIISSHPNFSLLLFFLINLHGLDFFFFSLVLLSRVRYVLWYVII